MGLAGKMQRGQRAFVDLPEINLQDLKSKNKAGILCNCGHRWVQVSLGPLWDPIPIFLLFGEELNFPLLNFPLPTSIIQYPPELNILP